MGHQAASEENSAGFAPKVCAKKVLFFVEVFMSNFSFPQLAAKSGRRSIIFYQKNQGRGGGLLGRRELTKFGAKNQASASSPSVESFFLFLRVGWGGGKELLGFLQFFFWGGGVEGRVRNFLFALKFPKLERTAARFRKRGPRN